MPDFVVILLAILLFAVFSALIGLLIWLFINWAKKEGKKIQEKNEKLCSTVLTEEGTHFLDNTKVLRKGINTRNVGGYKLPRSIIEFFVVFLANTNDEIVFVVSEDVFSKLEEGQIGTLVIMNGQFVDFGEGEDLISTDADEAMSLEQ